MSDTSVPATTGKPPLAPPPKTGTVPDGIASIEKKGGNNKNKNKNSKNKNNKNKKGGSNKNKNKNSKKNRTRKH